MARKRLVPVLTALGRLGADEAATWTRVCSVCAEVMAVDDVGVMLLPSGGSPSTLGASGPVATELQEAQFVLGEGPSRTAVDSRLPVEAPDLAATPATDPRTTWVAFTEQAVNLGVRAVTAFPLLVGAACLGGLDLYRRRPGPLTGEQFADALAIAELISHSILAAQAAAPADRLARELDGHAGGWHRAQVHQASGRIAVQLDIGVAEALVRLRAYAYANNRPIDDVAAEVMDGTLRLE